jgi:hypothetical protein
MTKLEILREKYSTEASCLAYLGELKWQAGYSCPKCGNKTYCKGRTYAYRKCKKCHYDESPTSGTLFHKIKFSLVKAFEIIYWITQTKKGMSTHEIATHFGIHQTTAWRFKKKVQLAMTQEGADKLSGYIEVDEFVVGGKEKKAQGRSLGKKHIAVVGIETMTTKKGKKGIKKAFCHSINGYSSDDFRTFFEMRIDKESFIKTDKWSGYKPLKKEYKIRSLYSKTGKNFKELHCFILNVKNWMRGTHHSCCNWHFQDYINEFCYRFNNRYSLKSAWEMLIQNMMYHQPVYAKNLFYGS